MIRKLLSQFGLFRKYFLNGRPAVEPVRQSDFTMYLEPVDLRAYKKTILELGFESKVIETISYEDEQHEILQIDAGNLHADKKLLIFAGVHGNEFAAALAIPDLLNEIKARPNDYNNWHIRIITPINPVGLALGSRYNENGYDINRDFKKFITPAGRVQRDAVESYKPDVLVSLHESPQLGFFMFSEGKLPPQLRTSIIDNLKSADIPLASKTFLQLKLQSGIWEKPPVIFFLQRLLGIYTLGYFMYKHKILAITTESDWSRVDIEARKKPHLTVIRTIIENF